MSQHTPKQICPQCLRTMQSWCEVHQITYCVHRCESCAGLNPAAYRECMEALNKVQAVIYEAINKRPVDLSGTWHDIRLVLEHTTEGTG